ncbi:DUF3499 family protein [Mycetocola tolaasinivorans]|uniref:DUF3499 family protein n=1 Tax=Mycetocola tolaasinivorans TaxID=76635 RepID=A0A3L7A857_9MICO|nr:DUF3499 family protein [Mycetocola tolaasinivorans]RLP76010.1 DUF3499 family protein [Mycetocola tolaasinivorans]
MNQRLCSRIGCNREAVATLTYDYADSMAVIGPLGTERRPHCYDLCAFHATRQTVPLGWTLIQPRITP